MRAWIALVLRHKVFVVIAWLAIAGAGGATAPATVDALSYDFSLPGQPAYETNTEIIERFGGGGLNDPLLLVSRADEGMFDGPAARQGFETAAQDLAAVVPGTRLVTPAEDCPPCRPSKSRSSRPPWRSGSPSTP